MQRQWIKTSSAWDWGGATRGLAPPARHRRAFCLPFSSLVSLLRRQSIQQEMASASAAASSAPKKSLWSAGARTWSPKPVVSSGSARVAPGGSASGAAASAQVEREKELARRMFSQALGKDRELTRSTESVAVALESTEWDPTAPRGGSAIMSTRSTTASARAGTSSAARAVEPPGGSLGLTASGEAAHFASLLSSLGFSKALDVEASNGEVQDALRATLRLAIRTMSENEALIAHHVCLAPRLYAPVLSLYDSG